MPQSTTNALIVAVTDEDIDKIKNGELILHDEDKIAIYKRGTDGRHSVPENYFIIRMSQRALNRVEKNDSGHSEIVTYGVRKIGDVNQELYIRNGTISERLGTDKTTKEQLIDDGMSEEDAEKYS